MFADSAATNDGSTDNGGVISIQVGTIGGAALLSTLGITAIEYRAPSYFPGYSYQAPRWRTTDVAPAPSGSIWQNISTASNGMSLQLKQFNTALDTWVPQSSPVYSYDGSANYGLDPTGGGKNIPVGSTYVQYDSELYNTTPNSNATFLLLERIALGATVVTGITTPGSGGDSLFTSGNSFDIYATEAGSANTTGPYSVTLSGTSVASFITDVSAANAPYVSASVNSAGNIVFTHSQGGAIYLDNITGTLVTVAGFVATGVNPTPKVRQDQTAGVIVLSNWVTTDLFSYTASDVAPDQNPADGRLCLENNNCEYCL